MAEIINTCSEAISLAKKLENQSSEFYKNLAETVAEDKDVFLSFVEENGKFVTQIERAYYGVITDAFEGCFAFNINPDDYELNIELTSEMDAAQALKRALEVEEKIVDFYNDAAEQSKSLMADVPRTFKLVAKKRNNRQAKLRSLLNK